MALNPSTTQFQPGPYNVHVPRATGQLQVEFSRDPSTFNVNRYMQIVPDQMLSGVYANIDTWEACRIVAESDYDWPDGQEAPQGDQRPFNWKPWNAKRKTYPFHLGGLTVDQADWDVVASHSRMSATKAMTARSLEAITLISTAANWGPYAAANLTALPLDSTENWYNATPAGGNPIKETLLYVAEQIHINTGGTVSPGQMQMVIAPTTARKMGKTEEIHQYIVNHERAMSNFTDMTLLDLYGLPPTLYGFEVIVEDAVRVTSRLASDNTATAAHAMPADKVAFTSRPGGLIGNGAPSFSTVVGFFHEEMNVETKRDDWNRLVKGRVTENRDIVLAAPAAGYFIDDVTTNA